MQPILVATLVLIYLSQDTSCDCIYIDDCPPALKLHALYKTNRDPRIRVQIVSAFCGSGGRFDMVNCNQLKQDNIPRNYENCGKQWSTSLITHGKIANLEAYPWLALLKYQNSTTGEMESRCHGSLINDRYILTAAHCIIENLHSVVLGEYDITTETDCTSTQYGENCNDPAQNIFIESAKRHPNFVGHSGSINYDIGLIRLQRKVTYTTYIKPICLPIRKYDFKTSDALWVAGWGKTENNKWSNVKRFAKIHYVPREECQTYLSSFTLDNTQVCAGSNTRSDTCRGDSGGPLMALVEPKPREHVTVVVGIVSFGSKCGRKAAIYTNTSAFIDWIYDNIEP